MQAERQLHFLSGEAAAYPAAYGMLLNALVQYDEPPLRVTVALDGQTEKSELIFSLPAEAAVVFRQPSADFPLKNGRTTFYVCRGSTCLPPVNALDKRQ